MYDEDEVDFDPNTYWVIVDNGEDEEISADFDIKHFGIVID